MTSKKLILAAVLTASVSACDTTSPPEYRAELDASIPLRVVSNFSNAMPDLSDIADGATVYVPYVFPRELHGERPPAPDNGSVRFWIMFRSDASGTFELNAPENRRPQTCQQCVLAWDGSWFFQTEGTMTVAPGSRPLDAGKVEISLAGVKLTEVEDEAMPSFVEDGVIVTFTDSKAIREEVPEGWTCSPMQWLNSVDHWGNWQECDCGCGVIDPDCQDALVLYIEPDGERNLTEVDHGVCHACDACATGGDGADALDCRELVDPNDPTQCAQ